MPVVFGYSIDSTLLGSTLFYSHRLFLFGMLFTGTIKLPNSTFCISKTTKPISTKFIYFCLTYTLLHISKLKEITSALLEIFVPKNCPIFFTLFFFFAQNYKSFKNNLLIFYFIQIWKANNAHLGLHFPRILRKIEGAIYYIIAIFSQFVVASTGCIINDKFLPNTIMLLKVDCLGGFLNQSNADELVINSASGCNCKNYKLTIA